MMQAVHCRQCDSSSIAFGQTTATIHLSASDYCGACRKSTERKRWVYFCTPKCLMTYVMAHSEEVAAMTAD